jgi:hypothetical protein
MSDAVDALYPTVLATIDVVIGAGFLYVRGLSPVGLFMTVLGAVVVCHVIYDAVNRVDATVTRVATGS